MQSLHSQLNAVWGIEPRHSSYTTLCAHFCSANKVSQGRAQEVAPQVCPVRSSYALITSAQMLLCAPGQQPARYSHELTKPPPRPDTRREAILRAQPLWRERDAFMVVLVHEQEWNDLRHSLSRDARFLKNNRIVLVHECDAVTFCVFIDNLTRQAEFDHQD